MSLDEFKTIFWPEYWHRVLGRAIGIVFFFPLVAFWLAGSITHRFGLRLTFIFALGGLQGVMGWYMVMSGLVDDPRVSHYRLTAHLGLAFAIFAAMLWIALDMVKPSVESAPRPARLARAALALVALVFVMILSGGLVAGLRAGYAYNTFPLMNGHFVPPEILLIEPWHLNFFNNMATVQFDHRLIAWVLMAYVPLLWWATRACPVTREARHAANCLLGALALQVSLGISTLLLRVPVVLGVAHQGGAVIVLAAALWLAHALRRPAAEPAGTIAPRAGFATQ